MKTVAIALSLALLGAVASGCQAGDKTVTKADIEADIAELVREGGGDPKSVTCGDSLGVVVGQSTQCEVEATPVSFLLAPIVTVTSVEGGKVNWEYKPALTQKQLERQVVEEVKEMSGKAPDSVSCDGGLKGEKGYIAYCQITADGQTLRRPIKVTNVDGLTMSRQMLPMMTRRMVEQSLRNELTPQIGPLDAVTCAGDLIGEVGSTVKCTIKTAPGYQNLLITVESATLAGEFRWRYEPVH
jgi:hypothetical protein